jgi:hypothetical protein
MGKQGKTIGGGIPGPGKVISGGHGMGKYGQPHKFYDKGMAKYKGPHRELVGDQDKLPQELKSAIEAAPGKYGMSQDHKMAYDRSEISRLKKDIHYDDLKKKGMSKYKSDAQRKAVHASKAEQGPGKMKEVKSVKAGNLKSYDLPGHGEVINKRIYMDPKNIKAKVLGGPNKMKKDKQKISKLQDDVLAGAAKYKYGKK